MRLRPLEASPSGLRRGVEISWRAQPVEIHIMARNTKKVIKDAGFSWEKYTTAAAAGISRR